MLIEKNKPIYFLKFKNEYINKPQRCNNYIHPSIEILNNTTSIFNVYQNEQL